MTHLPPCWPEGQACPNNCAHQLIERTVYNKTPLYGHWAGWRMAGRCLVSPDGDRVSVERLRGILWRESLETRYRDQRSMDVRGVATWRSLADDFRRRVAHQSSARCADCGTGQCNEGVRDRVSADGRASMFQQRRWT